MATFQVRNPCDPCRCSPSQSHYFYSERIPFEDVKRKKAQRPSSANSVKSSQTKKRMLNSSKIASSDSKLMRGKVKAKSSKNVREQKPDTKQLKQDLDVIKQQLMVLTKKNQKGTDDDLVQKLRQKCQMQEKEIEALKTRNESLSHKFKEQTLNAPNIDELNKTKIYLDQYENKLNTLYREFMETSQIMEQNRDKVCKCIHKKSLEYDAMVKTTEELSKRIEDSSEKYTHLLGHYEKSKENESRYLAKSTELSKIVEELENQLNQTMTELEISREEAAKNVKKHQEEINENCECFAEKLKSKDKEISELNETIQEMKKHKCVCKTKMSKNNELGLKYEQLLQKHKDLAGKYKDSDAKRSAEVAVLKANKKKLIAQVIYFQNYGKKLLNATAEHISTISELNSASLEKDAIIQCLTAELAVKEKQMKTLAKEDDDLKKRNAELREELVGMTISPEYPESKEEDDTRVLQVEECSIHLTEELQALITALYEEIDKTAEKDEQIAKQGEKIVYLSSCLATKEQQLIDLGNELKILKEQFGVTLKENQALADHLKKLKTHYG